MKKAVQLKALDSVAREHNVRLTLVRQGRHEIWECGGYRFPIPRHRDINEYTARSLIAKLRVHLEEGS